jgi:hypothetical protein
MVPPFPENGVAASYNLSIIANGLLKLIGRPARLRMQNLFISAIFRLNYVSVEMFSV